MSTKLNENQLIAVHLLASGHKSCDVAKRLHIRQETLSRWRQDSQFDKAVNDTTEIILSEIIDTHKNILILSQKVTYLLNVIGVFSKIKTFMEKSLQHLLMVNVYLEKVM